MTNILNLLNSDAVINFVNLTPHDIKIIVDGEEVVIASSGVIARLKSEVRKIGFLTSGNGVKIPITQTFFGEIEGLPEEKEDTTYVVSTLVAQEGAKIGRHDLLAPGQQIRNEQGLVIGCESLGIV